MADDGKPRPYDEFHRQDSGKVERVFNRVRQLEQRQQRQDRTKEQPLESEQVKNSRPQMVPTPNGPMRASPDRQAHVERSEADDNAVQKSRHLQRARELKARQDRQFQKGKGKDRDL